MKTKLHFGIIVILLAFFGRYLEQSTVPNQQIVIQFSDENISPEDTNSAIEEIQKKLQSIGVTHIQIGQHEDGLLKITYYSDADVARIQNILSKENGFKFAYQSDSDKSSDFPENRNIKDYELNISEIQNNSDINWDFEGVKIVELNQKTDRFNNPNNNTSSNQLSTEHSNTIVKVAIHINNAIALAIDNISYKIPEVRAGPSKREFLI